MGGVFITHCKSKKNNPNKCDETKSFAKKTKNMELMAANQK